MTGPFGDRLVVTVDPTTYAMYEPVRDKLIADEGLAKTADLAAKADASTVNTLSTTVGTYATNIATANTNASAAQSAVTTLSGTVAATAKTAFVAVGAFPVIRYPTSGGWPARSTWIAANIPGYTGVVEWWSGTDATAVRPTTMVANDIWTQLIVTS
jgi:hypothetical protein